MNQPLSDVQLAVGAVVWTSLAEKKSVICAHVHELTCVRLAKAGHSLGRTFHECQSVTSHLLDNDCHPLQC